MRETRQGGRGGTLRSDEGEDADGRDEAAYGLAVPSEDTFNPLGVYYVDLTERNGLGWRKVKPAEGPRRPIGFRRG